MKLYNEDFKLKDKNGTYYKSISYKGQLYLPVTCLEKGLGIPMEWEKAAKTLWIGGKADNLPVKAPICCFYPFNLSIDTFF